jgi:hypothetical protein
MKKNQGKNVKSQILFISLVLVSSFLLIINFIPIFNINAGLTTEFTGSFHSDYSIYVNQSDPDMNYYDDFGYFRFIGNSCETYLHYNFALLPLETEQLYFSLSSYDFYDNDWVWPPPVEDVEINIISIEESWNVSEITWNNKPEHGEIINTANISNIYQGYVIERYDLQKAADITEFYINNKLQEISLCINITNNNEELNNTNIDLSPRLLWNYKKVILSYTNIISTSIIFSMLIGTIYFLRKDIYVCTNCGAKKVHADIACPACETLFERDLIIKRSDYHLIFIVLLIFTFFEGSFLIITFLVQFLYPYYIVAPIILIIWMILFYQLIKRKVKHYKEVNL